MVFKDGERWFGVALEFNIVVEGEDPRVVEIELQEAVLGHLESAKKLQQGFRAQQVNALLNQDTEQAYEEMWTKAHDTKGIVSPLSNIYKLGIANLANV